MKRARPCGPRASGHECRRGRRCHESCTGVGGLPRMNAVAGPTRDATARPVQPCKINVSLLSHTNVGKTTLARTLLRQDIGEVGDRAHVTEVAESHVLIES